AARSIRLRNSSFSIPVPLYRLSITLANGVQSTDFSRAFLLANENPTEVGTLTPVARVSHRLLPFPVLKRFRKPRRQHIGKRCWILDLLTPHPVFRHADQFGAALAADDLTQLPARGCGVQHHVRRFKAFDC